MAAAIADAAAAAAPAPPAPFTLYRATEADMPEVLRLCWHSFPQKVRDLIMGAPTEADLPRCVAQYQAEIREDQHAVWLKVVDGATGRIAAASHWRVFPGSLVPAGADDDKPVPWLDEKSRAEVQVILDEMNEARVKYNSGGYVRKSDLVNIFFVSLPLHIYIHVICCI
jgi:hypothetical protein